MISYLGDFKEDDTILIVFNTFTSNDPSASCTITNFINTDVHIHKEDDLTQRNNAAGITVSVDFDGITGSHMIKIDTSDNTVAGFYVVAKDYFVRIEGTTIDGATINAFVGHFSIENRFQEVDVVKWLGQACHAVSENGVPKVDLDQIGGVVQSATDLKDLADAGYDPVNHEIVGINDGALIAAKFGADCITNAKIANDAIAVENIKDGAITAAKIADAAIDNATFAADVGSTVHATNIISLAARKGLDDYDPATKAEMDTAHALLATEAKQDIIDTNVDQIETAIITNAAGVDIAADIIAIKTETATIVTDSNELQTDWMNGGRLDLILDATLAMLDDARSEPAQGAPSVNPDAMTKIDYLYKQWRNKKDNDGATRNLYDDAGTVVDQKSTVAEAGGTVTVGEQVTGP